MITVLVKFKISNELNLKTLKEKFITNLKLFIDKKDLINQVDPDLGY